MTFYDYKAKDINGNIVYMEMFKDNVVLVVNTASKCGFTPQFEGLQNLYNKYKNQGFTVLGFPSSQFANQEVKNSESIKNFCSINYGVTFPMFEKVDVNGDNALELFEFLKNEQKGAMGSKSIKWNFTKFLIDRNGNVVKRFSPTTKPKDIEKYIKQLI